MKILETKNLFYEYQDGSEKRVILNDINIEFEKGKVYAILGKSGAGKTTLLSLLSGLDSPTSGEILFQDENIKKIGYNNYRKNHVGIVFQSYNLLPYMTAVENIRVAVGINSNKRVNKDPLELLNMLNITNDKVNRPVIKLSGGEQQRVAIARALATDVDIIFADEPTGNLDEETAKEIINILKGLACESDKCIIIVTHSKEVSLIADVIITLTDGEVLIKK